MASDSGDATVPKSRPIPEKSLKWIEKSDQKVSVSEKTTNPHGYQGYRPQSSRSKMALVMKNPLVPLGMLATCAALVLGLKANLSGDRFRQQMMMRYRVGFQGFTVAMIVGGLAVAQYVVGDDDDDE